ncbi:ion transporter [bacterium]|nr:ion transporter [bacterium]
MESAEALFDPCSNDYAGYGFEGFISVNVVQNRDIFFSLAVDENRDNTISNAEWSALITFVNTESVLITPASSDFATSGQTIVETADQDAASTKATITKLFSSAAASLDDGEEKLLERLQEFALLRQSPTVDEDKASSALADDVEVTDYVARPSYVATDWQWVADYKIDESWAAKQRPPIRCAELSLQCDGFEDPDQMLLQVMEPEKTCYGIATCVSESDTDFPKPTGESFANDGFPVSCPTGQWRPPCAFLSDKCPAGCDSTTEFPGYAECLCENLDYNANFKTFGAAFLTLIRMSTGEYWNGIQHDLTDIAGDIYAFAYFFSFLILATFIMLNLVVAVMIINYNEQQADSDRAVNQDHMDHFRDIWESFDEEGRGWIRTEKLPKLLEKLDIPLGFHSSKPMAKVAQKKALQELAMQLPDHDGWIHYTETLFALAYRNQSEQAVEDLPDDIPRVDEIQAQKDSRVQQDGQHGVLDPKPLQETMAVLSFQAVYRSYQERRNKGGEGSVDPLKRKLRPGQAALAVGGDAAGAAPDEARPDADYRANP